MYKKIFISHFLDPQNTERIVYMEKKNGVNNNKARKAKQVKK